MKCSFPSKFLFLIAFCNPCGSNISKPFLMTFVRIYCQAAGLKHKSVGCNLNISWIWAVCTLTPKASRLGQHIQPIFILRHIRTKRIWAPLQLYSQERNSNSVVELLSHCQFHAISFIQFQQPVDHGQGHGGAKAYFEVQPGWNANPLQASIRTSSYTRTHLGAIELMTCIQNLTTDPENVKMQCYSMSNNSSCYAYCNTEMSSVDHTQKPCV